MESTILTARTGRAFELAPGGALGVINLHGQQVVDTWAVLTEDTDIVLSTAHTRMALGRVYIRAGDTLVASDRQPLLELVSDTSRGLHDTLVPACDRVRYEQLGHVGYHDNCAENYQAVLASAGIPAPPQVPAPLNLFMNVPVSPDGTFDIEAPTSRPGDTVVLRALRRITVVLSACPQDIAPTNGTLLEPQDVRVDVYGPDEPVDGTTP